MADISFQAATSRDGTISITPMKKGESFPEFDEVEIMPNGDVYGWAGMQQPSTMRSQYLGTYYNHKHRRPDVAVVSFNSKEVILKRV